MRRLIIAGNWKMYKTLKDGQELAVALRRDLYNIENVDIAICPPFTLLASLVDALESSNIAVGAQDVYWEKEGAFTGEISVNMILDAGCKYVIIGHSERRQYFNETDESVNKKLKAALSCGLTPIVCIGETLKEREAGETFKVLERQLKKGFEGISEDDCVKIIIAYEPVWAIGTGKTATPQIAQEAHKYIRDTLAKMFTKDKAKEIRIQYGGSVKPENTRDLMMQNDIDGALVGGASLKADSFTKIINEASGVYK